MRPDRVLFHAAGDNLERPVRQWPLQLQGFVRRRRSDRAAAIRAETEALEKKSQVEEARWSKEKERLATALKRARS